MQPMGAPSHSTELSCHQEAYTLLLRLIDQSGLSRRGFLARLVSINPAFDYSEKAIANWGRPSRGFPHKPGLIPAILQILLSQPPHQRCSAGDAVRLMFLAAMPISELPAVTVLFTDEASAATLIAQMLHMLHREAEMACSD